MKSEIELGKNQLRLSAEKFRPMYLQIADNDTVSISM